MLGESVQNSYTFNSFSINCIIYCLFLTFAALVSRNPKGHDSLKLILDITSIIAQGTALVAWPLIERDINLFTIPLSLVLISFGWWENFVSDDSPIPAIAKFGKKVNKFENSRYFSYIFISAWKCALFFFSVLVIIHIREGSTDFLFSNFQDAFMDHTINITEVCKLFKYSKIRF